MIRRASHVVVAGMLVLAACGEDAAQDAPVQDGTVEDGTGQDEPDPGDGPATSDGVADPMDGGTVVPPRTDPPPTAGPDDGSATTVAGDLEPAPDQPVPIDTGTAGGGTIDPALSSFVDAAVTDLAGRLGVDGGSIGVVSAERVVWPDSSLGCPQPGMEYLQVLTDGYRILLSVGGTTYSYHGGGSTPEPFLCEQPSKPVPDAPPGAGGYGT